MKEIYIYLAVFQAEIKLVSTSLRFEKIKLIVNYFIRLWLRFANTWYWSKTIEFTVETNVFSCRDLTVN